MGHKHTHWLAATFAFMAVAQLIMVVDVTRQSDAIVESSYEASILTPRMIQRNVRLNRGKSAAPIRSRADRINELRGNVPMTRGTDSVQ